MLSGESSKKDEKLIIEKDIYDTFVEEIFLKQETFKIVAFKKRPTDTKMLEEAARLVQEQ